MYAEAASVLAFILWPLSVLTIIALWASALLDIARHRRRAWSTGAGSLSMAALVSAVAVAAVVSSSALFAAQWVEAVSTASAGALQAREPDGENPRRAYIFSFGLENTSFGQLTGPESSEQSRHYAPR